MFVLPNTKREVIEAVRAKEISIAQASKLLRQLNRCEKIKRQAIGTA